MNAFGYNALPVAVFVLILAGPAQAGTLTLTGTGVVSYTPDAVHLVLSTQTRAGSAEAARQAASERVTEWENATGTLRQQLQDYDDSEVTVTEATEYDDQGRPTDHRYFLASQVIRFDLTDLELLNPILGAAEEAALSYRLGEDSYYSTRAEELERSALAAAVDDAMARCEFVARKLDASCGPVESLRVFDQGQPPRPMMAMDSRRESVSQIGEREVRAGVEATFELD